MNEDHMEYNNVPYEKRHMPYEASRAFDLYSYLLSKIEEYN